MNKRGAVVSSVILLLVILAARWAYFRTDPVVAEMQQLRDEMMANRDLPEADRRAQWDSFRQRMDGLSDAQRQAVWENGRDRFGQFGRQRMDEFFQLPKAEQQKRLDEIIDRMQARQNNGGGRGGPGGWGGGRNMSDAQRDQRRKEMISRTDPKMRAQFDQFRQMMGQRMKERGIQGQPGGPWRG
jgi:hypothetical protein